MQSLYWLDLSAVILLSQWNPRLERFEEKREVLSDGTHTASTAHCRTSLALRPTGFFLTEPFTSL